MHSVPLCSLSQHLSAAIIAVPHTYQGGFFAMSEINKHDRFALLEAFKKYLYSEDTSRNTTSAYLSDLSHFLNWYSQTFEAFDIATVMPGDIRDYREYLQEQIPPLSPSTMNRRLAALRRFFTWGIEQHLTTTKPTERIRNVETTDHGPRSLDRKQWHRLQRSRAISPGGFLSMPRLVQPLGSISRSVLQV
jgi:site-specific recombinase XerD